MKILHVVHHFLPRHSAGVEVYTDLLTREQARRHDVAVFTTEHRPGAAEHRVTATRRGAVEVLEVVNNKNHGSFERTYSDPDMERAFVEVLDRVRPDVVHLQHLMFHSLGYIELLAARGIPFVWTLHEYWLICLRHGQMLLPDLTRCPLPTAGDCARCLPLATGVAGPLERLGDRVLRATRAATGVDLWPLARRARLASPKALLRAAGLAPPVAADRPPARPEDERRVAERWAAVRAALDRTPLLIAPSPFLGEMFVAFGAPAERVVVADYGFDTTRVPADVPARPSGGPLRFGFIGSLIPPKGVHVAVEAFVGVDPAAAALDVYGHAGHAPAYVRELRRRARGAPVTFHGAFDNARVADVLATIDALIVPSIWYENSPLSIHEAFLAGRPVLTSDLGGMRDLVEDGRNGFLFRPGDAADLSRLVRELARDPGRLRGARPRREEVKTVEQDAAELEGHYVRLRG